MNPVIQVLVGLAEMATLSASATNFYSIIQKKKEARKRLKRARRDREKIYHKLQRQLRLEDPGTMRKWIRLDRLQFHHLLGLVTPLIEKPDMNNFTAGARLSLTLRFLATGEQQTALESQLGVSHDLVKVIIPEVCQAIYWVLKDNYLSLPSNTAEWHKVANDFFRLWNYPMCIGARGGRRISMGEHTVGSSGSESCGGGDDDDLSSVVMLGLVDSDYKFLYMYLDNCFDMDDNGVWDRSDFNKPAKNGFFYIPQAETLPSSNIKCPYVFVGDDNFPLMHYIMKPYSGKDQEAEDRIFNYRLARAQRTSENAFGILSANFQVFKNAQNISRANVEAIVDAVSVLHNFLRVHSKDTYSPPELMDREDIGKGRVVEGQWRQHPHSALQRLTKLGTRHPKVGDTARETRETFKRYLSNEGKVTWQDQMALAH